MATTDKEIADRTKKGDEGRIDRMWGSLGVRVVVGGRRGINRAALTALRPHSRPVAPKIQSHESHSATVVSMWNVEADVCRSAKNM